jgi:hydrogenase maturation protein HypF
MSPSLLSESIERIRHCTVVVEGVVQGVGFRPFVYRLAHAHGLRGSVRNALGGVLTRRSPGRDV